MLREESVEGVVNRSRQPKTETELMFQEKHEIETISWKRELRCVVEVSYPKRDVVHFVAEWEEFSLSVVEW